MARVLILLACLFVGGCADYWAATAHYDPVEHHRGSRG